MNDPITSIATFRGRRVLTAAVAVAMMCVAIEARDPADNGLILANTNGLDWTTEGTQLRVVDIFGAMHRYESVPTVTYDITRLKEFEGSYSSAEADTTLTVAIERDRLVLTRRGRVVSALTPQYRDAFTAPQLGLPDPALAIFRRDASGTVISMSVGGERLWNLTFVRAQP